MTNKTISVLLKAFIIVCALIGLFFCVAWYPFTVSLTAVGLADAVITPSQTVEFWVQLGFYWAVSVPCFAVLAIWWLISREIKRGEIFSFGVAKKFLLTAKVLAVDLAVFVVGNAVFAFMGWNDFLLVYAVICLLGVGVAVILVAIAHLIKQASILREENEGTI